MKADLSRIAVFIGLFLLGIGAATRDQVTPLVIAAGAVIVALNVGVRE